MISLAQIESELARRTGPYESHPATGGTVSTVVVAELASATDTGEYDDRWLLRRSAAPADRQRRILTLSDPNTGTLALDRGYAGPSYAQPGETIEIVALDPTQILRQSARMGLSRCFFEDRVSIPSTTWPGERDLTDARAWLTRPGQLRSVEMSGPATGMFPTPLAWWDWFQAGGHLRLTADWYSAPFEVRVHALRPADSWVNDADSTTGPTADADTVSIDLEYAVVAAHKYVWEAFGERLAAYGATEKAVSEGWRQQIRQHIRTLPDRLHFGAEYGGGDHGMGQSFEVAGFGSWRGVATVSWRNLASYTWSVVGSP